MQEGWRRILTVEFSVRLVRTGKSLLMVQVSVSEPCRGRRERERVRQSRENSGTIRRRADIFTKHTKITSHVYDQNFILGRVEGSQGRQIPKVVTT